ncbi:MAG: recombinase family protein [Eubacteriales bacterium]
MEKNKIWSCASYTRLSREDKDGGESNSIKNQKELIREYIKSTPEICLSLEIEDDGFSGVDFLRPGFQQLLEEIKNGKINCVIVKDLSRLGRNYLEVGDYIEKIFPFMGVRFIAINDNYDSNNKKSSSDEIIIPFKNLLNEAALRDTSVKIRSQFEIKRKNGDYIGAFAPYGYQKSVENKNSLVVDSHAARVVRKIFHMKVEGYSNQSIADYLNSIGELPPYEYRKHKGENYTTSFKKNITVEWSAQAVGRILSNPVYIGRMVQGKKSTPNYKIKKVINKPEEEWVVVENTHSPIIDKGLFTLVDTLLSLDTRLGPNCDKVYLFSGMVFCGDCSSPMCRKSVTSKGIKYQYLICSGHKQFNNCSTHSFSETKLKKIVLLSIQKHIDVLVDFEAIISNISIDILHKYELERFEANLVTIIAEIDKIHRRKMELYEDFKLGVLTREEYQKFHEIYTEQLGNFETKRNVLNQEIEKKKHCGTLELEWLKSFKKYKNVTELTRNLLVSLIKEIRVNKDEVDIVFRFQDKIDYYSNLLENQHCYNLYEQGGNVNG